MWVTWKWMFFFISSVVAILAAILLNNPVPPGFQQPWKLRMLLASIKLGHYGSSFMEYIVGPEHATRVQQKFMIEFSNLTPYIYNDYVTKTDEVFDGVKVRIYKPNTLKSNASMIYIHGGGWTFFNTDAYDHVVTKYTHLMGVTYVAISYRLSLDTTFPVPLDDCVTAVKYFLSHASQYGVDPDHVGIAGDSAGGNLAAATAIRLRDENFSPKLHLQVLIYPALQGLDFHTPSYIQNANDPLLNACFMARLWLLYATGHFKYLKQICDNSHVSRQARNDVIPKYINTSLLPKHILSDYWRPKVEYDDEIWNELKMIFLNPHFSPLASNDLSGIPKTYIFTVEQDVLRDDGILYAARLRQFGVEVTHDHYMAGFHGLLFDNEFPDNYIATKMLVDYVHDNL